MMSELTNQPTWKPTRKLVAAVVAGMITAAFNTIAAEYFPDNPMIQEVSGFINEWTMIAVMAVVAYMSKNKAV